MPDDATHAVAVSSASRVRSKVLQLMVKESMWLCAAIVGWRVVFEVIKSLALSPLAHGYSFVLAACVELCSWLGTAVYFWLSGTCQQPVTRQQWRFIVTLSVLSSLVLFITQSEIFFWAWGGFHEMLMSLVPVIVMAIGSKFLGKTWTTARKLAVAPIVVGMAMMSFSGVLYASDMEMAVAALHVLLTATLLVLNGEILTGEMEMSPVQLVSRTAPLALAQTIFLALAFGDVTKLTQEESGLFGSIMYAAAARGLFAAAFLLCRLQAIKVTSPLTMSIAFGVYRVLNATLIMVPASVNIYCFIVAFSLGYVVVNYCERTRALTQLPQAPAPSPPRAPREGVIEEGVAGEKEGDIMLRPLLRAEAQERSQPARSLSLNPV